MNHPATRNILVLACYRWLLIWLLASLTALLTNTVGILCVAPMALLMTILAGLHAARYAGEMVMRDRVKLAATAGGITGLGIGVISSAAAFSTLLFQSVDDVEAPGFFLLLIPIGLLIGVVLGGLAGRIYRGHDRINPQ